MNDTKVLDDEVWSRKGFLETPLSELAGARSKSCGLHFGGVMSPEDHAAEELKRKERRVRQAAEAALASPPTEYELETKRLGDIDVDDNYFDLSEDRTMLNQLGDGWVRSFSKQTVIALANRLLEVAEIMVEKNND